MDNSELLSVCVNIDIKTTSLQTVVQQCKELVKPDEKGKYQVDPADVLSVLVSKFLLEKNFDKYIEDKENYPIL